MRIGLFFVPKCEFFRTSLAAALLLSALTSAMAQTSVLQINRVSEAPRLAALLDHSPPPGMSRVSDFTQREPLDGEAATQTTTVFAGFDDENLYVVFVADDDPALVRANLAQREDIDNDDRVSVTIDPFRDQRRAYVFESNPLGVQRDQTFVEGQGFDATFDTVWSSAGAVTARGYVVVLSLPFRSLRFSPGENNEWGIYFERTVQRGSAEVSTWPHISREVDGRLNQAATMRGIVGVSPGRNLQFIPYATASAFRGIVDDSVPRFAEENLDPDAGVDIKKVWRDSIVADLTLNPDFSQIESDQPQVTVNERFEVFFPERRPFFLENADIFNTPYNLLFTRRINDPRFGARLTAKVDRWTVGSLIANDELPGRMLDPTHPDAGEEAVFATARVSRDVGEQSSIGGMFVRREFSNDLNQVAALDGRIKWNDQWVSSWQAATSDTKSAGQVDLSGHATLFTLNRSGRNFNYFGRLRDISENFVAAAGFVPRTGIRDMLHFASLFWYPEDGGKVVNWGLEFLGGATWDRNGKRLDDVLEASIEWEFTGQTDLEINVNRSRERLTPTDFPTLVADREFDTDFINVEFGSAMWKTFAVEGDTSIGKRINFSPLPGEEPSRVDWRGTSLELSYRPLPQLAVDATVLHNRFDETDSGAQVIDDLIGRLRANWQFTRELSMRSIIQYERTDVNPLETSIDNRKNWNFDFLLTYRVNPWTAVYFGYNQNRQNLRIDESTGIPTIVRTDSLAKDSEQLILKISYLIRR